MKRKNYLILKSTFSIFMLVSAIGELTRNQAVVDSMEAIQMPLYLLDFLGVAKLLGITVLWTPFTRLKEWAYAGFAFDFLGALFGFIITGYFQFPDIIMAPMGLILCILTYVFWKKENPFGVTTENPSPLDWDSYLASSEARFSEKAK